VVPLAVGLVVVPLLDLAVKRLVRHAVADGTLSLGALGDVRIVRGDIWMRRGGRRLAPPAMWTVWLAAASALVAVGAWLSWSGWWLGLLLGGSLSHAIEVSRRGSVTDYVRLRFWPAFDLADVALAVGVCGVLAQLIVAVARP
jgi:signal peptidase II